MSDLIDRQALLRQIDIDSDGEPGYYGDTWKFIDTIKRMPSALSTNLAEVGTDVPDINVGELISRQAAIDAMAELQGRASTKAELKGISKAWKKIKKLPPAEPKTGKWVYDGDPLMIKCSNCGYGVMRYNNTPFCPNCGQKKEVNNESN